MRRSSGASPSKSTRRRSEGRPDDRRVPWGMPDGARGLPGHRPHDRRADVALRREQRLERRLVSSPVSGRGRRGGDRLDGGWRVGRTSVVRTSSFPRRARRSTPRTGTPAPPTRPSRNVDGLAARGRPGLTSLLFGQQPSRTPADVKQILATTAPKAGADRYPGLSYGSDPYGTCARCTWHPCYG